MTFFEAGKVYHQTMRAYKAPELLRSFKCVIVANNPTTGEPHAFGWYSTEGGWGPTGMMPRHWEEGWYEIGKDDEAPWTRTHRFAHWKGCHPEDAKSPGTPDGWQPSDSEDCWHCGTPTSKGCDCSVCLRDDDDVPATAVYHCPTCGRWWAYMSFPVTITMIPGRPDGD